jgi:hypothetical protein
MPTWTKIEKKVDTSTADEGWGISPWGGGSWGSGIWTKVSKVSDEWNLIIKVTEN